MRGDDAASGATTAADLAGRARAWAAENPPPPGAGAGSRVPVDTEEESAWRAWTVGLHEAGLAVPHWPVAWGGEAAEPDQIRALTRVLRAAGMPLPLTSVAIDLVAPSVMSYGTSEQQQRHLTPIARGTGIWTQLFSEPGAGSDLAALRTRATPRSDGSWVVTGQKVWSTYAQIAEWGYLLARTGAQEERHRTLSMFLVPMGAAGITVRPITEMTGDADFNEVFFEDVVLDADALLGEVGQGWAISMGTLAAERLVVGGLVLGLEAEYQRLLQVVRSLAETPDDMLVELARTISEIDALVALTEPGASFPTGFESAGKVLFSELNLELAQLGMELSARYPDSVPPGWARRWADNYAYARGYTISGGASEVLRNVMAQRGLGLPRP